MMRPDLVVTCITFYLSGIGLAQTDDANHRFAQGVNQHIEPRAKQASGDKPHVHPALERQHRAVPTRGAAANETSPS